MGGGAFAPGPPPQAEARTPRRDLHVRSVASPRMAGLRRCLRLGAVARSGASDTSCSSKCAASCDVVAPRLCGLMALVVSPCAQSVCVCCPRGADDLRGRSRAAGAPACPQTSRRPQIGSRIFSCRTRAAEPVSRGRYVGRLRRVCPGVSLNIRSQRIVITCWSTAKARSDSGGAERLGGRARTCVTYAARIVAA